MTEAHWHLLFNHMPIMGSFFGFIILTAGIFMKQPMVRKTAYCVLIFSSLLTLPAFFSGEGAEEMIEELPNISHQLIHEHEESAEFALWLSEILGILAGVSLFLEQTKNKLASLMSILTLILNLGTFASMSFVGNSGGEIRHPEIRNQLKTETSGDSPKQIFEEDNH
jgi:hypothetical protein